jgi:hypothetical protein
MGGNGLDDHMVRVGFGGGVSVPVSDAKDAFKDGVNGTGSCSFTSSADCRASLRLQLRPYKLKQVGG